MRTLHKTLHLQHHQHTGRVLHHRHTSYRGLAVILILAGVCVIGLSALAQATADSLYVYARIAAPVPLGPAIITQPTDGTSTDKASLLFTGICPVVTPQVVIVPVDNGKEIGSVPCDSSNNFAITITLDAGKNVLIARSYTITGDTGPDSAPVTITYNPPTPPSIPGTPETSTTTTPEIVPVESGIAPLAITVDTPFITFGPQKPAVWIGSITGGATPYTLSIDWGDGTVDTDNFPEPGQQTYQHSYSLMQPYSITVQVRDSAGQVVTSHYAAVTPYVAPVSGLLTTPPTKPLWSSWSSGPKLLGVYGAYLTVLATVGWVWTLAHPIAYAHVVLHPHGRSLRHLKLRRRP